MPSESTPFPATRTLTREDLEQAIDNIKNKPRYAHGTVENPHIIHPNGGPCMDCGCIFDGQ